MLTESLDQVGHGEYQPYYKPFLHVAIDHSVGMSLQVANCLIGRDGHCVPVYTNLVRHIKYFTAINVIMLSQSFCRCLCYHIRIQ